MDNVKEKIRKLLAKATSNNEHEAQAALLKARELMARYKVSEKELQDAKKLELNKVKFEEQSFSGLVNSWFADLARVVAENHCCGFYRWQNTARATTFYVMFAGLADDPEIARELFSYAVQHIQAQAKSYREYITARELYPATERRKRAAAWESSYANGFCKGLADQYAAQFTQKAAESDEAATMALALVQPEEVKSFLSTLKRCAFNVRYNGTNENAQAQGYNAGRHFNPVKQLAAQQRPGNI